MKATLYIILILFLYSSTFGQQYYYRGEVKDESGNVLQNVKIILHSSQTIFHTGYYGTFGIAGNFSFDSLTFRLDGYQSQTLYLDALKYHFVQFKHLPAKASQTRKDKLASITKDLTRDEQKQWFSGEETYSSSIENRFIAANKFPTTGLALNIDRASYSNIRRFLNTDTKVPPDAVRIEEMLNYFGLNYEPPVENDLFSVQTVLTSNPWSKEHQLFYVDISAKKLVLDSVPASQFVFLIDVSGSMDMANRLPLIKSAFRLLVNNLREKDTISIVYYGGAVGIQLLPTSGKEKKKILHAIDSLTAGGATPGESGIRIAYKLAKNNFIKGGNNRVILATDGDFNVGMKTESELDELISQQRESGIYLTCFGVGMGNYKDSKIQTLAKKGNGNFSYFDSFLEAERILLTEFTKTLYSVADDVYLNIKFNPEYVKEYRLIGFENNVSAMNELSSEIEGGEIGSGNSMMAVFEIVPENKSKKDAIKNYTEINLQYKLPSDTAIKIFNKKDQSNFVSFSNLKQQHKFAAAVIMFGSLLRKSDYIKGITWIDMLVYANEVVNKEDILQAEFLQLVTKAKTIYTKKKKWFRKKNLE